MDPREELTTRSPFTNRIQDLKILSEGLSVDFFKNYISWYSSYPGGIWPGNSNRTCAPFWSSVAETGDESRTCVSGGGEYTNVTDGFTKCIRITSKPECEKAATQLGFPNTTATEDPPWHKPYYPPGCYSHTGGRSGIKYNQAVDPRFLN